MEILKNSPWSPKNSDSQGLPTHYNHLGSVLKSQCHTRDQLNQDFWDWDQASAFLKVPRWFQNGSQQIKNSSLFSTWWAFFYPCEWLLIYNLESILDEPQKEVVIVNFQEIAVQLINLKKFKKNNCCFRVVILKTEVVWIVLEIAKFKRNWL